MTAIAVYTHFSFQIFVVFVFSSTQAVSSNLPVRPISSIEGGPLFSQSYTGISLLWSPTGKSPITITLISHITCNTIMLPWGRKGLEEVSSSGTGEKSALSPSGTCTGNDNVMYSFTSISAWLLDRVEWGNDCSHILHATKTSKQANKTTQQKQKWKESKVTVHGFLSGFSLLFRESCLSPIYFCSHFQNMHNLLEWH